MKYFLLVFVMLSLSWRAAKLLCTELAEVREYFVSGQTLSRYTRGLWYIALITSMSPRTKKMLLIAFKPNNHHSRIIQIIRISPLIRTAHGAKENLLNNRNVAVSCVKPFKTSNTILDGMKFLKNRWGHGIFILSISRRESPPQVLPEGSFHIIIAPTTAPMPMTSVINFWSNTI